MKLFLLINVKMPTIVGILTFTRLVNYHRQLHGGTGPGKLRYVSVPNNRVKNNAAGSAGQSLSHGAHGVPLRIQTKHGGLKLFCMLNSAEHETFPAHQC